MKSYSVLFEMMLLIHSLIPFKHSISVRAASKGCGSQSFRFMH